eukprot:gene11088-11243_t
MGMSETTGRCVVAKELISAGEVVVEVPDDVVLMADNCTISQQLADEGLVKPAEDALLEVQGLILAVMVEKARGVKSQWGPYLAILPADMTHLPLYWEQYQWATAAVASYSFLLGDDQYQGMVPVWDLLNHITGKVNVKLHHEPQRGVLQMIATQDIPKGCEVINCYGQLSNAELLRGYESESEPELGSESESESDEEEPDWDLEDDSEDPQGPQRKQQRQQQVGQDDCPAASAPSLAAAQQQIADWQDRWQLCFELKLLPKNGVFQVPAGGPAQLPGQLLSVLLLLVADAGVCERLAAAVAGTADGLQGQPARATDTEDCGAGGAKLVGSKKRSTVPHGQASTLKRARKGNEADDGG